MKWLNSIFPGKGMVYGGAALLLGLMPPPITGPVPAQEPPRKFGERLAEFSTTDAILSRKARDVLERDDKLANSQIVVNVKNRIATLKGTAASADHAKRAAKLVREITGMASVDNECIVAPVDSTSDDVAAAVKRAQAQAADKPDDPAGPSALTGRTSVSSKAPPMPPPAIVLYHPDLSAPSSELLAALEKVRTSEKRFRDLRYSVKSGVVRISGIVNRMSDANDFADQLTKIAGVTQVLLTKVEER